jgi:hypothetical protein
VLDDMTDDWSDEETEDPLVADTRNFSKVEKWTRDGAKVDSLLYAGNNLDARTAPSPVFEGGCAGIRLW